MSLPTTRLLQALAVLLLLGLSSCAATKSKPAAGITHVVIIWLKDHGNAAQREKVIATSHSLRAIPGVRSVSAGPCVPGNRPVIDSTFDVALVMEFESADTLKQYITHPIHEAAVRDVLKPLARKFVIYDFKP